MRHLLEESEESARMGVFAEDYSGVVILGGTNDLGASELPLTLWQHLKYMYDLVLERETKFLVVVTIPQLGTSFATINEGRAIVNTKIREYAASQKNRRVALVDLEKLIPHASGEEVVKSRKKKRRLSGQR